MKTFFRSKCIAAYRRASLVLVAMACHAIAVADPITPSKALMLAKQYLPDNTSVMVQVSAKRSGKFDTELAKSATGSKRISEYAGIAPYYIISRGAGNGFIIVSGDDCIPQIIGIVEHGDYDENDMPENFRGWLQYRADQVEYAQAKGINTPYVATEVPKGRQDVPFLLETLWHQSSPYNDKCPKLTSNGNRAATGCVATAASQIAYYWRREANDKVQSSTPTYTYGDAPALAEFQIKRGTPLKWDLMLPSYGSQPAEYKDAVATLVAMMGMSSYLTYGASTGGQIGDMVNVFKNQLGLNGGTCLYKSDGSGLTGGMTEAKWSELLYNQLIQKRPVLYCGYNGKDGGHAVVCDGYQASTGYFHINFGWGANYNGYFSVEDGVTGWGFNECWTGCVYDIYGKNRKTKTEMNLPANPCRGGNMNFEVTMTNNSTLPFEGVYLFVQTSSTAPSKLTSAKDSYLKPIPTDGTATFDLSTTITNTTGKHNVFLTDDQLKVLYQTTINIEKPEYDLQYNSISISSSSDTEEMEGEKYSVVYNNSTTINAAITNLSEKANYAGLVVSVYGYDETKKEWEKAGIASGNVSIEGKSESEAAITLLNGSKLALTTGKYYYAVLSDSISSSKDKVKGIEEKGNIVRFIMRDKDMQVVSFTDNVLTLKGHFDNTLFNSITFAKKTTYKTAVAYDLTQCEAVGKVSQTINPNALYYVSNDSKAEGVNIVKGSHAEKLVLTPGYDFCPREAFTVGESEINGVTEDVAQWYMLTTPMALDVPRGMAAREIKGHTTSSMSGKLLEVKTLEPGKTYLVMTSSKQKNTLKGGPCTVAATPIDNLDATVKGTYANTMSEKGGLMLDDSEQQLMLPVAEGTAIEALRGYMLDAKVTTSVKTYNNILYDKYYIALAQNLAKADDALKRYSALSTKEANEALKTERDSDEFFFSYREADADLTAAKSTAEQLEAAVKKYIMGTPGDVDVNMDCTELINNPSFEKKSTAGWTLSEASTTSKAVVGNGANVYRGVGMDESYLFYSMKSTADSTSVGISQTVKGLKPGCYRLTAKVGTSSSRSVTMFAGNNDATVKGHQFGGLYLTDIAINNIIVKADEGEETGSLTIGIKPGDWFKADDFRLTYVHSVTTNGDVNGDGNIDKEDVDAVVGVICGGEPNPNADIDGNGKVDINDVTYLISIICNKQ